MKITILSNSKGNAIFEGKMPFFLKLRKCSNKFLNIQLFADLTNIYNFITANKEFLPKEKKKSKITLLILLEGEATEHESAGLLHNESLQVFLVIFFL